MPNADTPVRPVLLGVLRLTMIATLLVGLLAVGALVGVSTVTAAPAAAEGPSVSTLLPAPSFPDLDVPRVTD